MNVTVGIVTYERPTSVARLLDSIAALSEVPHEVRVVDDSDSTETASMIAEYRSDEEVADQFDYTRRPDGNSMPGARNEVIKSATGDVIAFLDDDVVCEDGWLAAVRAGYEEFDVAGVGGPAIKTDTNLEPVVAVHGAETNQNTVNEYGEVHDESHRWRPPEPVETDVFRGANMSFRRDALRAVGGFDEGFTGPAIFEEWDVMTRIGQSGRCLLYHPDVSVKHTEAASGGTRDDDDGRSSAYWYARNSVRFRAKNFGEQTRRSLVRLAMKGTTQVPPVWRRLVWTVSRSPRVQFDWLRGYYDGLRLETDGPTGPR